MSSIFCPNTHLVLDAPRCETCGWERKALPAVGDMRWDVQSAVTGLGRITGGITARMAEGEGVLAIPSWDEVVGLDWNDGGVRWRTRLPEGFRLRHLVMDGKRALGVFSYEENNLLRPQQNAWLGELSFSDGVVSRLWEGKGYTMNPPALGEESLSLTSAAHQLVVFSAGEQLRPRWEVETEIFWPHTPALGEGRLVLCDGQAQKGEGIRLAAFDLASGGLLWLAPLEAMLPETPLLLDGLAVCRLDEKHLSARNLRDGGEVWARDFSRIYSALFSAGGRVFLCARGNKDARAEDHYLLVCLNPMDGKTLWETAVGGHARRLAGFGAGQLLAATDEGALICYDRDGQRQWALQVTGDEDPFRTALFAEQGAAVVGMYSGRVAAVNLAMREAQPPDPWDMLRAGKPREAGDGFALRGDFARAGEQYAAVSEVEKAFLLYARGALWPDAASLALAQGWYDRALDAFRRAGDLRGQAECLEKMGDEIAAAQCWEKIGDLIRAAQNYEKSGELYKAWDLYCRAEDCQGEQRTWEMLPPDLKIIEQLEHAGRFGEAAELAERARLLERAVKLFERAEQPELELDCLVRFTADQPEEWALRRQAELARKLERYPAEAEAWEKMLVREKAAEAYHLAAQQLEGDQPERKVEIAAFYQQALSAYEQAGLDDLAEVCRKRVIFLLHLPRVLLEGRSEKSFREGQFNNIILTLKNVGFGMAEQVRVEINTNRFEIEHEASQLTPARLAPGRTQTRKLYLRPLKEQVGETVPLVIKWSYVSAGIRVFTESITSEVTVKPQTDTHSTQPMVFNVSGSYYHAETISQHNGDNIQHKGDIGYLKGDRPDWERVASGEIPGVKSFSRCARCGKSNPVQLKFCQDCGGQLTWEER